MPKLLPKADTIAQGWLDKVKSLAHGKRILINVSDKSEQKYYIKKLKELREKLGRDEPVVASRIVIASDYKGSMYLVALSMKEHSPLVGFIENVDGTVEATSIVVDPLRKRKIKLMVHDGLAIEEINTHLDSPLSRGEIREYIEKGRFT